MEDSKRGVFNNKVLMVTLCVLVVAIVGIAVGITVVNLRMDDGVSDNAGGGNEIPTSADMLGYAEEIYDNNPENAVKVVDWFVKLASEDPTSEGRVSTPAWAMWRFFLERNDIRSLLDGMIQIDVSALYDLDEYKWYWLIVDYADKLGDEEIKSAYEPKVASLQYVYDNYVEDTTKFIEEAAQFAEEQKSNEAEMDAYWERMINEENKEDTE